MRKAAASEDMVIIGGGIAGALTAALLARAARLDEAPAPLLLERTRGPHHKICGEFLSWSALSRLRAAGFDAGVLGGCRIDRVRMVAGDLEAEALLPAPALGISRYRLDEALIKFAADEGARIERGVRVSRLHAECSENLCRIESSGGTVAARRVFLATGKTDLRGAARSARAAASMHVGFKAHFALSKAAAKAIGSAVELHFFPGGYAGLQHVENGRANLCLLVEQKRFEAAGANWERALPAIYADAPRLGERMAGAEMLFEKPLTIARVPYGYIYRPDSPGAGRIYRLGDQMAVIHSFAGDGMGIAALSAARANAGSAEAYYRAIRSPAATAVRRSVQLYRAAQHPALLHSGLRLAQRFPGVIRLAAAALRA